MSRSISADLSHKIILATALLVLGGIAGIIMFSGRVVTASVNKTSQSSFETYISDTEDMLDNLVSAKAFVTWQIRENKEKREYLSRVIEKVVAYNPVLSAADIAFVGDSSRFSEAWFASALSAGGDVWSEPSRNSEGEEIITFSTPIRNEQGESVAVLRLDLGLGKITSRLSRNFFYDNSYSIILSHDGYVLSHPDSTLVLSDFNAVADSSGDKRFKSLVENMVAGNKGIGEIRSQKLGAVYGPLNNGWSAAIVCPASEIIGPVLRFQLLILLIAIMDIIVLYFVTKAIISRTLLPITEVTYLAKNVAKGNFNAVIPRFEGKNEMHLLHEALRNMLHSINDYITQLRSTTAANERFESELTIASDIQRQMLRTDFINDKDVDIFATLKPAKEVGGDMYDFLRVGRSIYFAVGDVSGKGVPAALYMAISRSLFHYVSEMSLSTSNIVSCINSSFCSGNESNMFITLFVGRLDLDSRELVFCNAGHNPIVIISPDGTSRFIRAKSNMAAGVYDEYPYEKESITVEKGSRLLIYTDGVTEAEDIDKKQYGEKRLLEFADNQAVDTSSETFVANLLDSIRKFTNGNEQNDDITIMSVKV